METVEFGNKVDDENTFCGHALTVLRDFQLFGLFDVILILAPAHFDGFECVFISLSVFSIYNAYCCFCFFFVFPTGQGSS